MIQFKQEIESLRYVVKDLGSEGKADRYPDTILIHWWNEGQRRLSTIRPLKKYSVSLIETQFDKKRAASGQLVLPDDCYRLLQLRGDKNEVIPVVDSNLVLFGEISTPVAYVQGRSVYFSHSIPNRLTFFYDGYYPDVLDEDSHVIVPAWTLEALEVYVQMKVCEKEAIADARYRKFITKVDAGVPVNNPFLQNAKYFGDRFMDIINSHSDDAL